MNSMERYLSVIALFPLVISLCGCATTKGYFVDRGRDAKDAIILTAGVGVGIGADVRLGSLSHPSIGVMTMPKWTVGSCGRDIPFYWSEYDFYWPVTFILCNGLCEGNRNCKNSSYSRCLHYGQEKSLLIDEQFVNVFNRDDPESTTLKKSTQLEVGASLAIVSARVGVNILELADFILGWATIDILKDDKEAQNQKELSNQSSQGTARKLAAPER